MASDCMSRLLQKAVYDKTGQVQLSVEEQLRQNFVKGTGHLQGGPLTQQLTRPFA